jgi:hypothetical protein
MTLNAAHGMSTTPYGRQEVAYIVRLTCSFCGRHDGRLASSCLARPAAEVAEEVRRLITVLYGDFLSRDGKVWLQRLLV